MSTTLFVYTYYYIYIYIYIAMSATTRVSPMYYIFIGDAVYYISYIIV